jgi:hypothetical protein
MKNELGRIPEKAGSQSWGKWIVQAADGGSLD